MEVHVLKIRPRKKMEEQILKVFSVLNITPGSGDTPYTEQQMIDIVDKMHEYTSPSSMQQCNENIKEDEKMENVKEMKEALDKLEAFRAQISSMICRGEITGFGKNIIVALDETIKQSNDKINKILENRKAQFLKNWSACNKVDILANADAYIYNNNQNIMIVTTDFVTGNVFFGSDNNRYQFIAANYNITKLIALYGGVNLSSPFNGYTANMFGDSICYTRGDIMVVPFTKDGETKYYQLKGRLTELSADQIQ